MPSRSESAIRVRAALPHDRRAVRDLCARIWEDDYVPDVFDEWVRDRRGRLWVATCEGRVIGIAKLTLLGDREAWLHALRVDPRSRRRGAATALLEHRLARARRLGARVARLDTSEDNVAIRLLMRRFGFHVLERAEYHEAPARRVEPPRLAVAADLEALWPLARRGDGLLHQPYTVRRLTKDDLANAIRRRRCYVIDLRGRPAAVAIAEVHRPGRGHGHGARIAIRALGGTRRGVTELLERAPGIARGDRVSRVGIPAPSAVWPMARAARYRRPWSEAMLLYERAL